MSQKNKRAPIGPNKAFGGSGNARYRLTDNEADIIGEFRRLTNEAIDQGIDPETVKHAWIKSDKSSLFVKNPFFNNGITEEDIENTIKKIVQKQDIPRIKFQPPLKGSDKAIKVTLSDSHVGMNPSENALFQYDYNADIYAQSMDKVFNSIMKEYTTHGTFDLLLLDDLGDLADGWSGQTTRGGHDLPQNMTNAEVFEVCVKEKVDLITKIINSKVAKKIMLRCVSNDNHAGDFALIINKTIQLLISQMYSKKVIEVDLLNRFLEHRIFGDHCFILTHGKDKKHMKRGLPLVLNDTAIKFISDYIEHYGISSKYIHLEKGDLHQIGYQKVKRFDYRNYMSFAPPSNWVQHNFGDCYSGYSIQIVPKYNNEISHTDYFVDYKKK